MSIIPDFDNAAPKSVPDISPDEARRGPSEYSIDGIPVQNTVPPPAGTPHGPTGKVPIGLPFD